MRKSYSSNLQSRPVLVLVLVLISLPPLHKGQASLSKSPERPPGLVAVAHTPAAVALMSRVVALQMEASPAHLVPVATDPRRHTRAPDLRARGATLSAIR